MVLPRIFLGTSPFIAAGQFGHRSFLYYETFYQNPDNILKIIRKSHDLGINNIQLIPFPPVVKAVQNALEAGLSLTIAGSVRMEYAGKDIEILKKLNATALITHSDITDCWKLQNLSSLLGKMKESGKLVGIATHKPRATLAWLKNVTLDYDIIMLPLNALGVFMDGKPEEIIEMLEDEDKHIIAMKTLAAGMIPPTEALQYIAKQKTIQSVALGIASEREMEETLTVAKSLLTETS